MESKVCHTVTSSRQEKADFVQIYSENCFRVYLCYVSILQLKLKLFSGKRIMNMDFPIGPPG